MDLSKRFREALRPTFFRFFIALIFLSWQYFYSYMGIKIQSLGFLGEYIGLGLGTINWNHYFVRSGFMVVLWLLVAVVIFGIIWLMEFSSVWSHNKKIEAGLQNRGDDSDDALIKKRMVSFRAHFLNRVIIVGSFFVFFFGLFVLSDILEGIRYAAVEGFVLNLMENNVEANFDSIGYLVLSFFLVYFVWFIYSGIMATIYNFGKERQSKTEIEDDHFAITIDEADLEPEE